MNQVALDATGKAVAWVLGGGSMRQESEGRGSDLPSVVESIFAVVKWFFAVIEVVVTVVNMVGW